MRGTPISLPEVAVVDDGDLEDVCQLLDELGVEFAHWTKASTPAVRREPGQLLVATAALAVSLGFQRTGNGAGDRPVWIAVTSTESRTQRSFLLQSGFDYLVRRPVHPTALRLLIRRALYRGDDLRRGSRVAVGYGIRYRAGLRTRRGTLVDLSPGGCRLLCPKPVDVGAQVRLRLPAGRDGAKPFPVTAAVVRTRRGDLEGGDEWEHSVALRFAAVPRATRSRIRALLAALASGPARLGEAEAEAEAQIGDHPSPAARQRAPRGAYDGRVIVFGEADCVVVGRDLSRGGMCIDRHAALSLGDEVRLAIPAGAREEPVVVRARVARDDGERGLALTFESVEEGAERLDKLISGLPAIESLAPEAGAGIIPSRLLPKLLRVTRLSRD